MRFPVTVKCLCDPRKMFFMELSLVVAAFGNRLLPRVSVWYNKGKYQIVPRTKLNHIISSSVADHRAAHVSSNEMELACSAGVFHGRTLNNKLSWRFGRRLLGRGRGSKEAKERRIFPPLRLPLLHF